MNENSEWMPQAKWNKNLKILKQQLDDATKSLSDLFIQAVIEHDGQRIINLADAAWFFKGKTGEDFKGVDPKRHSLLTAKYGMKVTGSNCLTIKEIVDHLKHDGINAGSPADGYSQIRRMCKELKIPICPSRKIRKK